jgi:anthranilate phosphoribosyltransferase
MKKYIEKCLAREALTVDEASAAVETIMEGGATDAQIAGLLIALRAKGETVDELLGFARVMRRKAIPVRVDDREAMDIVGTGGDGLGTFNISTASAFVVAGSGITVAKHGNRSVSSQTGSADVLTALGVNVQIAPDRVESCINTLGIGFMFAPLFHPAMKAVARPRVELGVRTIFNMLGPLTNPAGVRRALVGAYRGDAADKMAGVLSRSAVRRAVVVHGDDGMDEISLSAKTNVVEVNGENTPRRSELSPEDFDFVRAPLSSIHGGTNEENAHIIRRVLSGERFPPRDIVVMNAAIAIQVAGKAELLADAKQLAEESLDSGRASRKLQQLVEFTNRA